MLINSTFVLSAHPLPSPVGRFRPSPPSLLPALNHPRVSESSQGLAGDVAWADPWLTPSDAEAVESPGPA